MSFKRGGGGMDFKSLMSKKQKTDANIAQQNAANAAASSASKNRYLKHPVKPDQSFKIFLIQARNAARSFLPKETLKHGPIKKPFCEIEARLGILKIPYGSKNQRITSSGAKHVGGKLVQTYQASSINPPCIMESGVSRSHFFRWTQSGLSGVSPLSQALGVTDAKRIKSDIVETEYVETVYSGYSDDRRVCYNGVHPSNKPDSGGKMETKMKLAGIDLTIPAANYDLRINLATEKILDPNVSNTPPPGWTGKRIKRRRSYARRDKSIVWQIDVTEVTSSYKNQSRGSPTVDYEIEFELRESVMLQLINEQNQDKSNAMCQAFAQQLWWIITQINPLDEVIDVEEKLQDHPDKNAVRLALAQCGALKKFMDSGRNVSSYVSPIHNPNEMPSPALSNVKFVGCMPINFSRHNIDEVQRSPDNGYFLSEKTDGVRHFMIFTGSTVVLVDRAMKGKQLIPVGGTNAKDPMSSVIPYIKPGTVLDGEVVMYRSKKSNQAPRPLFIVFDVLTLSTTEPILQLPFEERLKHLNRASFTKPGSPYDVFQRKAIFDNTIALPLVRKNFVKRTDIQNLLSHVVEERGIRTYRNGDTHNHMTDGIIFQPNLPYTCGTDHHLLKWKYLDTVTIDVEILPPRRNFNNNSDADDEDELNVACLGEDSTLVNMSRYIKLPNSERRRLEADRAETNGKIAEVGFDPETGEWYYLTMRPDKIAPNHISTVLGTLLELAESLTTEELHYRMSIPPGSRDTYRKELKAMHKQLLNHQRSKLQASRR